MINKLETLLEKVKKLQKEVNNLKGQCRTESEWNMCKSFIEKDLNKLGYELNINNQVNKKGNK